VAADLPQRIEVVEGFGLYLAASPDAMYETLENAFLVGGARKRNIRDFEKAYGH
jgi:hypothetical protein